jgi:hypothetical protein
VVRKFLRFCDLFSRDVTARYKRVSPGAGPTHLWKGLYVLYNAINKG